MARIERGAPVAAERAGGRGRRDNALRQRIAADQPVYDDTVPEGVVARREVDEDPAEGDFGEAIDPAELVDTEELIGQHGDGDMQAPDEWPLLIEGDVIFAKVTHAIKFDDEPSYFSYGVATKVQPDEEEDEAFDRVSSIVNTRSLDLAYAAEPEIEKLVTRTEQRRRERVNQNSGRALRGRSTE